MGTDNVFGLFYGPNPNALITPEDTLKKEFQVASDAVTANASVIAVAYEDRTAEGDPNEISMLFKNRAMHARHAQEAADLLAQYPSSPTEVSSHLARLNTIHERPWISRASVAR